MSNLLQEVKTKTQHFYELAKRESRETSKQKRNMSTPSDTARLMMESFEADLIKGTGLPKDIATLPKMEERLKFWESVALLYFEKLLLECRFNDSNPSAALWPHKIC